MSAARQVTPQPPPLRHVEVITQFEPDLAQVSAIVNELLGCPPTGDQDVGVREESRLWPSELVLEELMEFRQSHVRMIPAHLSTGIPAPD